MDVVVRRLGFIVPLISLFVMTFDIHLLIVNACYLRSRLCYFSVNLE
jgi:hypothetical protein